ncbi:MAG: helix-turn-helix domain-containing protein [Brevundimonas sp.]|uniref:helix-turn-helix domain-containing protein n=1 Tax=Brevundimonas sp. TaxID=1871086 RepID=UPI0039196F7B
MDIRRKLGARVQRLRQDQGWSQEEFADRAGLHRTYVSGVERGVRNPTVTVLEKLAIGLGVPMPDLVSFDG